VLVLHPIVRNGRARELGVSSIDWESLDVEGTPRKVWTIFGVPAGAPAVVSAHVIGGTAGVVRVAITTAGGRSSVVALPVRTAPPGIADALAVLWATSALPDDRDARRELALRYGLVSADTALVAIDGTPPTK
jgi:hypothetical protein